MKQDEVQMPPYLNASFEGDDLYTGDQVRELMKLVAAKEREACAEVRDLLFALADRIRTTHLYGPEVRKMLEQEEAIRARGEA